MSATEFRIKKGVVVYSKGVDSTILDVQGESGQIFSVIDNLVGLIHHVSDISGIPIFEVYSDNVAKLGKFGSPALVVRESAVGSSVINTNISSTTTLSLDMGTSNNIKRYTLGANLTINFETDPLVSEGVDHTFIFKQDGVGGRTLTWNTTGTPITWDGGSAPTISTGANSITAIRILWTGSEYLGAKIFS
jgi:hypothetical protein